ncbi:uncharacterized protein B0H18DRAFT_979175, partial [Fomitopsis serialis]|uniref:uncharacterized protein n=1 Tax=Fomitopsis serialis TaxID=139415 RepID=UPI002007310E
MGVSLVWTRSHTAVSHVVTLFMYDRALTIGQEVELCWGRRVSIASGLCLLMQVSALVYLWMYTAILSTT